MTDSSCDLPEELLKRYNIRVVPLVVTIDEDTFRESIDLTPQEFFEKMEHSEKLPKTSQPSPAAFVQVFRESSKFGQVICITISSKISGTYQAACLGRELSGLEVTVFDSLAGSLGHGMQVIKACEMAKAGCTLAEVVESLDKYRKEMKVLILLNTLDNIVKGGRLSKLNGTVAKILDIKILLHSVEGEIVLQEKVRGKKKFLDRILHIIYELCPDMTGRDVGITHFNNFADVEIIKQALKEKCHPRHILINYMGSTMATYAGDGGIIVCF